jgi:hypothetical protein
MPDVRRLPIRRPALRHGAYLVQSSGRSTIVDLFFEFPPALSDQKLLAILKFKQLKTCQSLALILLTFALYFSINSERFQQGKPHGPCLLHLTEMARKIYFFKDKTL